MSNNSNVSIEEIKKSLMEDPDFEGGWTGAEWQCSIYGSHMEINGEALTMLIRDTEGRDELMYITLMPSIEPRHYDAWIRKPGEDSMQLLLHCKAADAHGMREQLLLRSLECLCGR